MRIKGLHIAAAVAILSGVLTILAGGRALFGDAGAKAAVGNAVPFVLWFNFLSGFAYVGAGAAIWLRKGWAIHLTAALVLAIGIVFALFGLYVAQGGAYEDRTVGAMALRSAVWIAILLYLYLMRHLFGGQRDRH
jgi:hypothetical protein